MKNRRIDDDLLVHAWPEPKALSHNSVVVLTGPTASGKSALGMHLAEQLNAEIVSCDSMQIYKHLDIGTAKPSLADQAKIAHHLLDLCEVEENFSVARYACAAQTCFAEILSRGKIPLLLGGTTLYVSALVERMQFPEYEFDASLRQRLAQEAEEQGSTAMYQRLQKLDPEYAAAVHPNNTKRVLRALERLLSSQMPNSERLQKHAEISAATTAVSNAFSFDYRVFCQSLPRAKLYQGINNRVEQMLSDGLLPEVQWLMEKRLPQTHTCMQAIGYKELFPYLRKEESLSEAVERLKANTRQYAKRQLSWYRAKDWPLWLFPQSMAEALDKILKQLAL